MPGPSETETPAEDPDRFETIAFVYSQPELSVLLSLLEDEGVEPQCVGRLHAALEWNIAIALGGTRLRVHHSQAAQVRARLATIDQSQAHWAPVFVRDRVADAILILAFFLLGLFPPVARIPAEFVLDRPAVARRTD